MEEANINNILIQELNIPEETMRRKTQMYIFLFTWKGYILLVGKMNLAFSAQIHLIPCV